MVALCLISAVFGAAGTFLVLYAGGAFSASELARGRMALVALIALYPLTLISVFLNVAIASSAAAVLNGDRLDLREALGAARARLPQIALLSLFMAGVGFLLSELAARIPGGSKLGAWLLGAAWALATIFAVPLVALENANATAALRGSARLIKSRWGEGITGTIGIGVLPTLIALPAGALIGVGFVIRQSDPALSGRCSASASLPWALSPGSRSGRVRSSRLPFFGMPPANPPPPSRLPILTTPSSREAAVMGDAGAPT